MGRHMMGKEDKKCGKKIQFAWSQVTAQDCDKWKGFLEETKIQR